MQIHEAFEVESDHRSVAPASTTNAESPVRRQVQWPQLVTTNLKLTQQGKHRMESMWSMTGASLRRFAEGEGEIQEDASTQANK